MIKNFVIIIGAMKCGTTSLFHYLSQHPQISGCSIKEPGYFSKDQESSINFQAYQDLWRWDIEKHKVALEASTIYSRSHHYPHTTENIVRTQEKYGLSFKFIYVMRNPIERIESDYMHGLAQGWYEEMTDYGTVIPYLVESSRYAKQLEKYYDTFSADDILLINFLDIKYNLNSLLSNICHFLEIDSSFVFSRTHEKYNSNEHRITNDPLWSMLKKYSILKAVSRAIPIRQKEVFHSLFGKSIDNTFKLSPKQKEFVLLELNEDLRTLNLEHGFNTSSWGIEIINT